MRTTVTLDPDTAQIVRRRMREHDMTFKEAINSAIRDGSRTSSAPESFETLTAPMGRPSVNLDRALQIAAELEDDELVRRLRAGS